MSTPCECKKQSPVLGIPEQNVSSDCLIQFQIIQSLLAEAQVSSSNSIIGIARTKIPENILLRTRAKDRCSLCNGKAEAFYCKDCVKNGNFYHSSVKVPERFAEKRLRESRLNQHIKALEEKVIAASYLRTKSETLREEVTNTKGRLKRIRKVLQNDRRKVSKAQDDTTILLSQIGDVKKNLPEFQDCIMKLQYNVNHYKERIQLKKNEANKLENKIKYLATERSNQLTTYIFPMSKITSEVNEEESDSFCSKETVKELAEALQTHYVEGRWITTSHFSQQQNFNFVSAILPGSGKYASFIRPHSGTTEADIKKDAQNICAGLSLLCQFVNILAFYFGVHLPKRISFSDFSEYSHQDMKERKFQKLVAKLNVNVIYLCVSQGVPPSLLHPLRALPNLMALLHGDESDLGRFGSFEFSHCLLDTLEEVGFHEDVTDSDSDEDWETVNNIPVPDFSCAITPSPSSVSPFGGTFRRVPSEDAPGIVSSAASSMISILRGFTGAQK